MQERLNQLQEKFKEDAFVEKLFSMETPENVQSLLHEEGLEFTLEEIAQLRDALVQALEKGENGELSDESLDGVAGGIINTGLILFPRLPIVGPIVGPTPPGRW